MGLVVATPITLVSRGLERKADAPKPNDQPHVTGKQMRRLGRKSQDAEALDISPLSDVVFILLIFFMVSTTFVKDAQLELERPSAHSATPADTKAVRVSIDRYGDVYLGDTPVRLWMLQGRVREQLRASSESAVLVIADQSTSAEQLIDVVDQCRLAGAKNVGVVTNAENASLGDKMRRLLPPFSPLGCFSQWA